MEFNIETEYQKYLQLVGLDEMKMIPQQRTETRRAFIAGYGMCYRKMEEVGNLSEKECFEIFKEIEQQVADFFNNQAITKKR